jgi:hypothetical protein
MTLAEATRESRLAVRRSIAGEAIDWAVPVLYTRDPGGRMCESGLPAAVPVPAPAPAQPGARRKVARLHRIGVWDINHAFPRLEQTLGRMNEAQDRFGFQLSHLSAPLGTWRTCGARGRHGPGLDAERLSRAFVHSAEHLGLDGITGITDQPLIGHGDARGRQALSLFSTAGLGLALDGPETDRALAHALVRSLARRLAGLETHTRPPRTCPLFFDRGGKRPSSVGSFRFDATCRARVLRAFVAEGGAAEARRRLAALDHLLTVFHPSQ